MLDKQNNIYSSMTLLTNLMLCYFKVIAFSVEEEKNLNG